MEESSCTVGLLAGVDYMGLPAQFRVDVYTQVFGVVYCGELGSME